LLPFYNRQVFPAMENGYNIVDLLLGVGFFWLVSKNKQILGWEGMKSHWVYFKKNGKARMFHLTIWPSTLLLLVYELFFAIYASESGVPISGTWIPFILYLLLFPINNIRTSIISFINFSRFSGTDTYDPMEEREVSNILEVSDPQFKLFASKLSFSENYKKRQRLCVILMWICFSAMVSNGIATLYATIIVVTNFINTYQSSYSLIYNLVAVWYTKTCADVYFAKLNSPNVNTLVGFEIPYPSVKHSREYKSVEIKNSNNGDEGTCNI